MESAREVIDISSDEGESADVRIPAEVRVHPGGKKEAKDGGGNDLPPGASPNMLDDDDCLILDGAPESLVAGLDYAELRGEMLDEVLIVGEKGQFACRDYPHPRYLCATFLFNMTPHKKHCGMCHCYVCDCPAPCIYWETHCSSTHKEHSWRVERRRRMIEQQHLHPRFDVKLAFTIPNRPASKFARPSLSSTDRAKSARHSDSRQHFIVKPTPFGTNWFVSNSSSSSLSNEPKLVPHDPLRHAQTSGCRDPLGQSKEVAAPRPKDILCEIYKICPIVISCRRRIPPSLHFEEPLDANQDD